jgi:hypothetical protein
MIPAVSQAVPPLPPVGRHGSASGGRSFVGWLDTRLGACLVGAIVGALSPPAIGLFGRDERSARLEAKVDAIEGRLGRIETHLDALHGWDLRGKPPGGRDEGREVRSVSTTASRFSTPPALGL